MFALKNIKLPPIFGCFSCISDFPVYRTIRIYPKGGYSDVV